jgi:hypothetical protein
VEEGGHEDHGEVGAHEVDPDWSAFHMDGDQMNDPNVS